MPGDDVYTNSVDPEIARLLNIINGRTLDCADPAYAIITAKEKERFAAIIALQITRGQKYRRCVQGIYQSDGYVADWDRKENDIVDPCIKTEMGRWALSKTANSSFMQSIHNREWIFYESTEHYFITSDEPIVFTNKSGTEYGFDK